MKTSILLLRMPCLPMVAARLRAVDGDLPRPKGWQLSTAGMRALCACLSACRRRQRAKRAAGLSRADPQQGKKQRLLVGLATVQAEAPFVGSAPAILCEPCGAKLLVLVAASSLVQAW